MRRTLSQRSAAHSGRLRPLLLSRDARGGQTSRPNTPSPREQAVTTSHHNTPSATASFAQHPLPLTAGLLPVPAVINPHPLTSSPPVRASYGGGRNTGAFPISSATQTDSAQGSRQSKPSTFDSLPTVRPSPATRNHPALISPSTPSSAFGEAGRATHHIPESITERQ